MPGFGYGFGLGRASGGDLAAFLASRGLTGSVAGADFRARRYWLPATSTFAAPRPATEAEFFAQFSAATATRTYVNAAGNRVSIGAANVPRFDYSTGSCRLLLEDASTNLIIGSAAPATQNVTTTATSYTLALEGTGSITLSGTATGTLSGTGAGWQNRVKLTITATAGTLTLTVSGSVQNVQLEAKTAASSYIPTTVATVTRAIETFRLPAALEAVMQGGSGTGLLRSAPRRAGTSSSDVPVMFGGPLHPLIGLRSATAVRTMLDGSVALDATPGSGILANGLGAAFAWDANGAASCANGGTVATSATSILSGIRSSGWLGRAGGGGYAYGDGFYDLLAIWPARLLDARLPALATPQS